MLLKPAERAFSIAASASRAEWRLFNVASSSSLKDWAPMLSRLMPQARRAASFPRVRSSGFASTVISASSAEPEMAPKEIDELFERIVGKDRRGTATEVKRVKGREAVRVKQGLLSEAFEPGLDKREGRGRVKVAVRALPPAEGNVNVKPGQFVIRQC